LGFRELEVWQEGKDLVVEIYRLTEELPKSESYGITSQLRRAAVSVPCNIAEGYGRNMPTNYAQFLRIAKGSLNEVETLLVICADLKMLDEQPQILTRIAKLGSKLTNLITSVKTAVVKERPATYLDDPNELEDLYPNQPNQPNQPNYPN